MSLIALSSFRVSSCGNGHHQIWPWVQHHLPSSDVSYVLTSFFQQPCGACLWKRHSAGNDPGPRCHRLSPAPPRMHPCSLVVQFQVLLFLKSYPPLPVPLKNVQWSFLIGGIWGNFNFLLPYLFFSNSIMYFPWNKGTTYYAYLCDNHSSAFYSNFITRYTPLNNKLFSFACFEILYKSNHPFIKVHFWTKMRWCRRKLSRTTLSNTITTCGCWVLEIWPVRLRWAGSAKCTPDFEDTL